MIRAANTGGLIAEHKTVPKQPGGKHGDRGKVTLISRQVIDHLAERHLRSVVFTIEHAGKHLGDVIDFFDLQVHAVKSQRAANDSVCAIIIATGEAHRIVGHLPKPSSLLRRARRYFHPDLSGKAICLDRRAARASRQSPAHRDKGKAEPCGFFLLSCRCCRPESRCVRARLCCRWIFLATPKPSYRQKEK